MYTLKAFRGSSTFEQTFTNKDAYLEKLSWLQANGFTIGDVETHTRIHASSAKISQAVGH